MRPYFRMAKHKARRAIGGIVCIHRCNISTAFHPTFPTVHSLFFSPTLPPHHPFSPSLPLPPRPLHPDITALTPLTPAVPSPPSTSRPASTESTAFPASLRARPLAPLAVDYGVDHCMGCTTSMDGSAGLRLDNLPCRCCFGVWEFRQLQQHRVHNSEE